MIEQRNTVMANAEYIWQANNSAIHANGLDSNSAENQENPVVGFVTVNQTLVNGTEVGVRAYVYELSSNGNYYLASPFQEVPNAMESARDWTGVNESQLKSTDPARPPVYDNLGLGAAPPSQDYTNAPIYNQTRYNNVYADYGGQAQQVTDNVDVYVDDVYTRYESGELNLTNVVDPATLAGQAASSYNDTGYYSFAATSLATMGYSGDLNTSVTVEMSNTTYSGTMFYTADDVSNFTNGTTYNPADLNGTVWIVAQENESAALVELDGEFTITDVVNPKTGETRENVTVQKYVYDSHDASQLEEELNRLSELRQKLEEQQANSDGSGGGWFGGIGTVDKAIIALAAIALILVSTRN
jgi:hypothetical protein